MSEMIERVAKAICQESGCEDPDCDCPYTGAEKLEGRQARAAIEAMREPTDKMLAAALDISDWEPERQTQYQAMIDEVLKET